MADNEFIVTVKANTKPAEKQVEDFGDKFLSVGKAAAGAFAGLFAAQKIVGFLKDSVKAAVEGEAALKAFNAALAVSGQYTKEASNAFAEYALKLEQTTGVTDSVILKNAALLVSVGKLTGDGLEKATAAALDLAKGMQVDVGTAFDIVTKASQGSVTALSKYGLEVRKGATDSEKFAATLDFIDRRFGGMAQGSVNTFQGSLTKASNGFEKILESVGKFITKSPKLTATTLVIADSFYDVAKSIGESEGNLNGFIDGLFKIGIFVTQFLLVPLEGFLRLFVAGLGGIPALALSAYTAVAGISDKLLGTDLQSKVQPLRDMVLGLQKDLVTPIFTDEELFTTRLVKGIESAKSKVDELANKLKDDLPKASTEGVTQTSTAWQEFSAGFSEGLKGMAGDLKKLGSAMSNTLVNGMTNAFSAMGKAIATGGDAFGEFGKQVLSTIGSLAIQLGSFLILAGLGFSVIPGFQASAGAVVAGAALIVLGGILQGIAGGGGTPTTAASGTTGTGGTAETSPVFEPTKEEERAKPETGVQVIVQGNILNTRESALEIAKALSDSFDTNGTIVRGFA